LARASVDHQHGGLHGAGAEPVQGFLAGLINATDNGGGDVRWAKKDREDEPTKDFREAVKAVGKPSKKEKKRIDKIVKHLPKRDKI
jgi:hypothetical protein